jgi:hypothetical protein
VSSATVEFRFATWKRMLPLLLEKIASDFFDTAPHCRRQKARFLPPARPHSYARAGRSL